MTLSGNGPDYGSREGPVGIIAGGHELPLEIAEALKQAGREYFLFGLSGEADTRIANHPHAWLKWGEIGRLFAMIEQMKIRDVLFIGSITSRPDFKSVRLDFGAVKALPEILKIMANGGDEGVLSGLATFIERRGLRLMAVPDVAPGLVVGDDLCVGAVKSYEMEADVELAAESAVLIGALDAGQGVVVAGGRILAMEGPEGTDQMLERVAMIREQKRARWKFGKEGLLLKRARPGQDLRFDMPTIGPRTVENANKAGLAGIICAAGQVLCVNRKETIRKAGEMGLILQSRRLKDISL